jgi:hypothetical protein
MYSDHDREERRRRRRRCFGGGGITSAHRADAAGARQQH